MPNPYLVGNGRRCPHCSPGDAECDQCHGTGRIPYTEAQIVASTVPGGIPVEEQETHDDPKPVPPVR